MLIIITGCLQPSTYKISGTGDRTIAEKFEKSQFGIAISYSDNEQIREDLLGAGLHWAGSLIIRWDEVEHVKGELHWEKLDRYIDELSDEINLLIELRLYNRWASFGGCDSERAGSPLRDEYIEDLDNFLKLIVRRTEGKVKYWSIGNEMEIKNFWCCSFCKTEEESEEEYLKILKIAYNVIKKENKNAVILLGGFTGNWKNGTNVNPEFVKYILKNGKEYFDILDLHLYEDPKTYKERVKWFIELMNEYGYSKPIWSTEMGGPDIRLCGINRSREKSLREILEENECTKIFCLPEYRKKYYRMHAEEVVKRYVYAFDAGVSKAFWWKLYGVKEYQYIDYEHMSHLVFSKMGLIATERGKGVVSYMKTPAYYTYKIMIEELEMFDSVEKLPLEGEVFLFEVNGKDIIVAWSEKNTTIDLSRYFDNTVRVRHIVTELDGEAPVYKDDGYSPSSSVSLEKDPVFITETEE